MCAMVLLSKQRYPCEIVPPGTLPVRAIKKPSAGLGSGRVFLTMSGMGRSGRRQCRVNLCQQCLRLLRAVALRLAREERLQLILRVLVHAHRHQRVSLDEMHGGKTVAAEALGLPRQLQPLSVHTLGDRRLSHFEVSLPRLW